MKHWAALTAKKADLEMYSSSPATEPDVPKQPDWSRRTAIRCSETQNWWKTGVIRICWGFHVVWSNTCRSKYTQSEKDTI